MYRPSVSLFVPFRLLSPERKLVETSLTVHDIFGQEGQSLRWHTGPTERSNRGRFGGALLLLTSLKQPTRWSGAAIWRINTKISK